MAQSPFFPTSDLWLPARRQRSFLPHHECQSCCVCSSSSFLALCNSDGRATLKDGREVCLEPTAAWVKRIIKAILDK
ncbi:hypothetical protein lerEdw1_017534 [Lerista edwardsae]|nr:hypothetical protein lerEdw1_017534 [Lerista edwardsae]